MGLHAIDWLVARQLDKRKKGGNLFEISLPRWVAEVTVSEAEQEWQELCVRLLGVTI